MSFKKYFVISQHLNLTIQSVYQICKNQYFITAKELGDLDCVTLGKSLNLLVTIYAEKKKEKKMLDMSPRESKINDSKSHR